MKTTFIFPVAFLILGYDLTAQTDSLDGFDMNHAIEHIREKTNDINQQLILLEQTKRNYIFQKYPPITKPHTTTFGTPSVKSSGFSCSDDNWGFEDGNLNGWTTSGYVTTVASGTDPYGNYPWVYPLGGNVSAKISGDINSQANGKLERQINVPLIGETLLSFHFAMSIFNYPHSAAEASKFYVEFFDQNGNQLGCPYYECFYSEDLGAVGVSNFQTTPNPASSYNSSANGDSPHLHGVSYSSWNDVTLDLTTYAGQTITVKFKIDWCIYSPDWSYALIDVDCPINTAETVQACTDFPKTTCGPPNMASYEWYNTGGILVSNDQCFDVPAAGLYTLKAFPANIDCSPGSLLTFTYGFDETPVADFDYTEKCVGSEIQFNNLSSAVATNFTWDFDDGAGSSLSNPQHEYSLANQYNVTLFAETQFGCRDTITKTVVIFPKPSASFVAPATCLENNSIFTDNSSVTTTGNDVLTAWHWDYGDGNTSSITTSHLYTEENIYNVELIVETNNGCTDTIIQPVTVWPLPNVNFSPTEVCYQFDTQFSDNSTISNAHTLNSIVGWNWDFGDGNTSAVQHPSNSYLADGLFPTTLEVTSNNGCISNLTLPVTVHPLPQADFNVANECVYYGLQFNNTSSSNTTAMSWDFGDGTPIETTSSPTHEFANANQYSVSLMVVSDFGCTDTLNKTVIAYPQPTSSFSVNAVCYGLNSDFIENSTVTSVDNDQIINWEWNFGDGNSSSIQHPNPIYGAENVYTVSLIVTTSNGCTDTVSNSATVYPLPLVNFIPTDVCLQFDTQFTDLSTISNSNTTNSNVQWNWSFATGSTSTTQNPVYRYITDGVFNATLEVTTNNGCVNDTLIPVTVHPKPQANFSGINLSGCSPICAEIISTSTVNSPSSVIYYQWKFSDGYTAQGQEEYINRCLENNSNQTEYYGLQLIVATEQGCMDTISEQNYIQVFHNPIASFNYSPNLPDIVHSTVEFNNNSQFADNYYWLFGNFNSSTETDPTIIFPFLQAASYDIILVASTDEGCVDTAKAIVPIADVLIYYIPNSFTPDGDEFNNTFQPVFSTGFDPYDFNMLIFNRWGEIVFETKDANTGWDGTYSEKLVQEGTYTWKVEFKLSDSDARKIEQGHVNVLR